jgi:hypothetical protein
MPQVIISKGFVELIAVAVVHDLDVPAYNIGSVAHCFCTPTPQGPSHPTTPPDNGADHTATNGCSCPTVCDHPVNSGHLAPL